MNSTQSLAQQFAAEYAKGVVPAMVKSIHSSAKYSKLLLAATMLTTYLHVATYLYADPAFRLFGFAIPLIIDGGMIIMFDVLQTRAMAKAAKRGALVVATALGLFSGFLNWIAAETVKSALVFAGLVLIAVAVKFVAALMAPDFAAMEQAEQSVTLATPAVDEEAAARRSEIARKAAETRRQNAAEAVRKAEEAKARRRAQRVAPTSPGMPAVEAPSAYELNASYL